jgi:DNA polymerase III subunit alpha
MLYFLKLMYLIFDTETTGLPRDFKAPITDTDNWPRCIQLAWQLHDELGQLVEAKSFLVKPDGFDIPYDAERIHGISTQLAQELGHDLNEVLDAFNDVLGRTKFVVGQNIEFDLKIMGCELHRFQKQTPLLELPTLDTCTEDTAKMCQIPGGLGGKFKLPTLSELHQHLFNESFVEAHNATADVEATSRCFLELIRREFFSTETLLSDGEYLERFKIANPEPIALVGLKHLNLKAESKKLQASEPKADEVSGDDIKENLRRLEDVPFVHLHNHSRFSVLQSTIEVNALVSKAAKSKMPAVALTDSGNMYGAFLFEKAVSKHNKAIKAERAKAEEEGREFDGQEILPIIGIQLNVCRDHTDKTNKDNGYEVVFLAKDKTGYHNLAKMSSIAYTDGFYYVPRISKEVVEQYKEGVIVLTGNLRGEVPSLLLNVGEKQAEEALLWWKEQFQDDLYIEMMRHGQEDEDRVNVLLLKLAKHHNVKIVATNCNYYLDKQESVSHDILLCVKDGQLLSTPKGRGRGFRYGLDNDEYYFKSSEEMKALFADLPEAIESAAEIYAKCEPYTLQRDILLPNFDFPEEFKDPLDEEDGGKRGENAYLRHLTYEGAKERYGEITDEIRERLDFELKTIENSGYPGYFLIVQDFCHAARQMGVWVGPGRGSAAGSAVAYCLKITNVDPIKYDLLFERFLNPERVSMPDIDIDFDDEGRGRVIDYVINKYGANQVAQIITYGTMAAKSSVRDTARVLNLPLPDADKIAKLIPDISLNKLFKMSDAELADKLSQEDLAKARELKAIAEGKGLEAEVVKQAISLEGSMRNTGIHACGVIITPDNITNFVPVATAKDSDMVCTQFDNSVAEDAGLLKMDFLGLKTLTLLKDAVELVRLRYGIELNPDDFPIDDELTYELFQRGETVGIFQYESPGMQKYLRELKPTVFGDLIAMNALYRPGPLEYIPSFVRRKNGEEEIKYDLDACEEYLKETYGITVYQEQVMLLSQKLADFTKGEADVLRKAMGKKQKDVLDKMKPKFIEQAHAKGHPKDILEKIWRDWEAFASYAFNKSHSTCYAWVAYQTAYLKAHYPSEYMAAVLSNNMSDIKQVSFFMEECRRAKIPVLGPDVNESLFKFAVNKDGAVRFGLGAIKGVGEKPVSSIFEARQEGGAFKSPADFTSRVDLRVCNKRVMENLVLAGGFDSFSDFHRAQFFAPSSNGRTYLEDLVRYGGNLQSEVDSAQVSLFGDDEAVEMPEPIPPKVETWNALYSLNKEKEVVGIYISGHPLDDFKHEIKAFCTATLGEFDDLNNSKKTEVRIAGIITKQETRITKRGDQFGDITIEDFTGSLRLMLFNEDFLKYRHYMVENTSIYIVAKIVPKRFTTSNEKELKIQQIELLRDFRQSRVSELKIHVDNSLLTASYIQDMHEIFTEHTGKCRLRFIVKDELNDLTLSMPSKTVKVDVSDQLIRKLEDENIEFELA